MAFPTSGLTNNQVHKEGNRAFVYDSALGVWDQVRETDRTENKIVQGEIGAGVSLTNATFPAGHIIKVTTVSRYDTSLTANNNIVADSDANDIDVTCTIGNKLHIWIVGGMGYAANSAGYFGYGVRIVESGQSDIDFINTLLYSRSFTSGNQYLNDTTPSVMYTHTAVTASVTIKRFVKAFFAQPCYWANSTDITGTQYKVMEEQV